MATSHNSHLSVSFMVRDLCTFQKTHHVITNHNVLCWIKYFEFYVNKYIQNNFNFG